MTKEQIQARLKALDQYELAVKFSMPDEGDLTSRELLRIITARGKLKAMLEEMK